MSIPGKRWVLFRGLIALPVCLLGLCACDPVTRHQTLSTLFDGVPSLPPTEVICRDELAKVAAAGLSGADLKPSLPGTKEVPTLINHTPYAEKRCPDCHGVDKDKQGGLVVPRLELCAVCHPDFLHGTFQHGPAAVGDCLACHQPHSSINPALLVVDKKVLCSRCHREERLAQGMHDRFRDKGIGCIECHDPHAGDDRFFLK